MTDADPLPSRRQRLRAQTLDDIKRAAREQLRAGGLEQVTLNGLARMLGMSAPGLYRYFASRENLLAAIAADGWAALAEALEAAAAVPADPPQRLRAVIAAFRGWALADPNLYWLVFASPYGSGLMGGEVAPAAQRCMAVNIGLIAALMGDGQAPAAGDRPDDSHPLALWRQRRTGRQAEIPAPALELAILMWTRFHGLISVEIQGGFSAMGIDTDLLVEAELARLIAAAARAGG